MSARPAASRWFDERRTLLRVGGGLAVSGCLGADRAAHAATEAHGGSAKSCILIYLLGGPPQLDTFDLKPEAAAEVRGPFKPIASAVPGVEVCEHLPRLARLADKFSLIRSVSYPNSNHTPMIYYTLTGRPTDRPELDNDIRPPQRTDFPHLGAVLSRLKGGNGLLPGYVAIPEVAIRSSTKGEFKRSRSPLRGGSAGFLGAAYDPLTVNGELGSPNAVPALALPADVIFERFERRTALLSILDGHKPSSSLGATYQSFREQAVVLTGSGRQESRQPFRIDTEPAAVRTRYGEHPFGRAMLLARRLAEAAVPMIAVHFNEMTVCDGWDTHSKNFEGLKDELLPMLDQGVSALLEDLEQRGLLEQTVCVCMGEFGRTPKINGNAGRDHWGPCSSALLAGGGIRGGRVVGASDAIAAYPVSDRVDPTDIHATIHHCLGVDRHELIYDLGRRPWEICTGQVIDALL